MTAPNPNPLLTGLRIGECARWHDGRLWLANWGEGEVLAVDAEGRSEVMVEIETDDPDLDRLARRRPAAGRLRPRGPRAAPGARRIAGHPRRPHGPLAALVERDRRRRPRQRLRQHDQLRHDGRRRVRARADRRGHAGRVGAPGRRRAAVPERHGRDPGQLDPDLRRVVRRPADRVRHRGRRQPLEPARLGRARRGRRRDLHRRRGRRLVARRQIAASACARAARSWRSVELAEEQFCFACALGGEDGRTLFMLAAPWLGAEKMFDGPPSGEVRTFDAPAAGAGRP